MFVLNLRKLKHWGFGALRVFGSGVDQDGSGCSELTVLTVFAIGSRLRKVLDFGSCSFKL